MPITTLPALSRTATTFKADVDTFFGTQLPAFATEANALESNVNAKEANAVSSATTATTKAGEASASAAAALASQNSASTSAATATTKAGEASTSATSASGSAATATTKANEAAASAASVVRDGSGGVAGLTLFKLNLKNALGTVTSWFTTAATVARTWTLPDKDGTVAMTSDITGGTQEGSFATLSSGGVATLATTKVGGAGDVVNSLGQAAGVGGVISATDNPGANYAPLRLLGATVSLGAGASGANVAVVSSTGLSVEGALSATKASAGDVLSLSGGGANTMRIYSGAVGIIGDGITGGGNSIAFDSAGNTLGFNTASTRRMTIDASGNLTPGSTGAGRLGTTSLRWGELWVTTGAFNTSDARQKTPVSVLTVAEIAAAKQLSKEIGTYQWLASVAEKGPDKARLHVGITVQRAQEILESFGLDPWRYGFMAYDKWADEFTDHAAIEAVPAVLDDEGNIVTPAVEAKAAWTEQTKTAGDAYAFRYDQLNLFIAAGLEARLTALETA